MTAREVAGIAALCAVGCAVTILAFDAFQSHGGEDAKAARLMGLAVDARTLQLPGTCDAGYARARIGGTTKCLRAGQVCSPRFRRAYRHHGFECRHGRLTNG